MLSKSYYLEVCTTAIIIIVVIFACKIIFSKFVIVTDNINIIKHFQMGSNDMILSQILLNVLYVTLIDSIKVKFS